MAPGLPKIESWRFCNIVLIILIGQCTISGVEPDGADDLSLNYATLAQLLRTLLKSQELNVSASYIRFLLDTRFTSEMSDFFFRFANCIKAKGQRQKKSFNRTGVIDRRRWELALDTTREQNSSLQYFGTLFFIAQPLDS